LFKTPVIVGWGGANESVTVWLFCPPTFTTTGASTLAEI
jgi:hypothetical protein